MAARSRSVIHLQLRARVWCSLYCSSCAGEVHVTVWQRPASAEVKASRSSANNCRFFVVRVLSQIVKGLRPTSSKRDSCDCDFHRISKFSCAAVKWRVTAASKRPQTVCDPTFTIIRPLRHNSCEKLASPTARSDLQLTGIGWRKLEKEIPLTNDLCLRS